MTFYQFLSVLRGRWQIALGVFALCVLAAQLKTMRSPRLYTATASVVVDAQSDPVANAAYPGRVPIDAMATQTDIVTSQRVAERVANAIGFAKDPALKQLWRKTTGGQGDFMGWLATSLQRTIAVPPPRESNVITIQATWSDGKNAARIANAFAQAYIDTTVELRVQPAKQYAAWFDERSRELRADLEAKQKRLSDYQQKEGIIGADGHLDTEMSRLEQLSAQLVTVQAQRDESQSKEMEAKRDDAAPEIILNPVIDNLKGQLGDAQAKLDSLATELGPANPGYLRAQTEVNSLKERLSRETARIIASLHEQTQVDQRRERALVKAIAAQKQRVAELQHQRDDATLLQNDVTAAQRNLDTVSQGLAQTSLESEASQANAALLTRATEPAAPSSPKPKMNLAVGIFLGFALGIALVLWLEKMDQRVRSNTELRQLLGVPLLASFGGQRGGVSRASQIGVDGWASKALPRRSAARKALSDRTSEAA
jgi:chain length determinant protein EpsF